MDNLQGVGVCASLYTLLWRCVNMLLLVSLRWWFEFEGFYPIAEGFQGCLYGIVLISRSR